MALKGHRDPASPFSVASQLPQGGHLLPLPQHLAMAYGASQATAALDSEPCVRVNLSSLQIGSSQVFATIKESCVFGVSFWPSCSLTEIQLILHS